MTHNDGNTIRKSEIIITASVDGKTVDYVYQGQAVRLKAEISHFTVNKGQHHGKWILPDREVPVDLFSEEDPQAPQTFWHVGHAKPSTYSIVFELYGPGAKGLIGRKRIEVAPVVVGRAKEAIHNITGAIQGNDPPGETIREVLSEAAALGSEVVNALHEPARTGAAMISATHDYRRMTGDLPPTQIEGAVSLQRSASPVTEDSALWLAIKQRARAISFSAYHEAINDLVCDHHSVHDLDKLNDQLRRNRDLPFNDTDAYRFLKVATEAFLLANVGTLLSKVELDDPDTFEGRRRLGPSADAGQIYDYLEPIGGKARILPYYALVLQNMGDAGGRTRIGTVITRRFADATGVSSPADINAIKEDLCENIAASKIGAPLFLELIWSYWQEEGMLVQTMNAISRRFQNVRAPGTKDPLAALEMNPLRPLNNVLWGYVQDEQHRLSVVRRAYEYDHAYGISLHGKAISDFRPADSRSRFIEAFHTLLSETAGFYRQDDDTTVIADGFQVRNAITEVHFILSEGAHNQFGDLPATARQEMMLQQWMLSRPEFQEFLPSRAMVAYPEPWMHRVEAMKNLQRWTDASILHFNRLATTGEQILLSIRYGAWNDSLDPAQAVNWARFWRPEIQSYIHAYRAVTGVDLGADAVDVRLANDRLLQPAVLLRRRLGQQKGATPAAVTATLSPMPSKSPARR